MDKEKKAGGYDYLKAENARLKEEAISLIAELASYNAAAVMIIEPEDEPEQAKDEHPAGCVQSNVADLRFTFMDIVREVDFRGALSGDFKFTEAYVKRN